MMSKPDFTDRRQAGRELANKLKKHGGDRVVLALPRGGVEVAREVAVQLGLPLDLVIARKIGHPTWGEYAIGAVTETGPVIWNEVEAATLDNNWLKQAEEKERAEAKRRRQEYLGERQPVPVADKTIVLVDDGIATGLTMQAALREVNKLGPAKVIVAVPVSSADVAEGLLGQVDEVITLVDPYQFRGAISAHYSEFPQLSDEDVISLLGGL